MTAVAPLSDYHIHTARCGHAGGEMDEYVARAEAIGLSEIGFADHMPLFHTIDATLTMSWDELPIYLADVRRLQQAGRDVKIKLGIEADFLPDFAGQIENQIKEYDFDYVMGSVHFVDGWGIDDRRYIDRYQDYDLARLYERYFELLVETARSGLFDILAHPDLIKKYFQLKPEPVDLYAQVIKKLASTGVAIEFSSAGLRKPCAEPYPSYEFLKLCRRQGIPVALGSDAHAPGQVGDNFSFLLEELKRVGYSEIALFEKRQRTMVPID